jgi:hypothetical protein
MSYVCWIAEGLFSWEALTALGTVAATGVIFWQLRVLNRQVKLQQYVDYTKRYQEIALNFPENVNDPKFKLGKRPIDEYNKTMRYMRAYFDLCYEEWDLNRRRLIDLNAWKVWEGGMKTAFGKTAFQQAWKIIKDSNTEYGPEFESFVTACFIPR